MDIVLQEAYRTLSIREGDKVTELTAIQAVLRSMSVAAMKGNHLAQRAFAEIVQKTESREAELRWETFKAAVELKVEWETECKRCDSLGIPRPTPVPIPTIS